MEKEQAYRDKDSEAGVKKWSSKAVIIKMAQRQPLNIANIKSQEPEGNSDVPYFEETASPEILRINEIVLATTATKRTFTKDSWKEQ